jgi:dihydrodipicolinate synthase/N-acetylneuraminate lyase
MDNKNKFKGIFVPVITPFTEDDKIYEPGIINLLEYLKENKINGVWLLGSYGGFPLQSEDERMQVAEIGLGKAKRIGMTSIVNVGSLFTGMTLRLARHAQNAGANAIASVVPFYYSSSHYKEKNFLAFFGEVLKGIQLPAFFYNNERATGYVPNEGFFIKLLELGITGFKSKGDYLGMAKQIGLVKQFSPDSVYLSGSTSVHLQGYLLGADGVTSGVALAVPRLVTALQNALENKEIEEALRLQQLVLSVREIMGKYVGRAVSCYDLLQHKGVDVGTCRSPWLRMKSSEASDVIREIKRLEDAV